MNQPLPTLEPPAAPRFAAFFGVGSLLFAAAWCVVGWWLFSKVGTGTLMMAFNEAMTQSMEMQAKAQPVARPPPSQQRQVANPLGVLSWQSPAPTENVQPPVRTPELDAGMLAAPKNRIRFHPEVAEPTRMIWAGLTFCCAAVMAVCGASALAQGTHARRRARNFLVLLFWASLIGVIAWRVKQHRPGREVLLEFIDITQSRHVWAGFLTAALLVASLFGMVLLAARRRNETLRRTCIGTIISGTLMTLVAIAIMIEFAGFPALPGWFYAVAAVAQSSWAWILLVLGPLAEPNLAMASRVELVAQGHAMAVATSAESPLVQTPAGDAVNY